MGDEARRQQAKTRRDEKLNLQKITTRQERETQEKREKAYRRYKDITDTLDREHRSAVKTLLETDEELFKKKPKTFLKEKRKQMGEAVKLLDFETAALLRDEIKALEEKLEKHK